MRVNQMPTASKCSSISDISMQCDVEVPCRWVEKEKKEKEKEQEEKEEQWWKRIYSSAEPKEKEKGFAHRASHVIIDIPVAQLKRMRETDGVGSLRRETQHFIGIATLHGPLRIYRGKGWRGWLWAVWTLCSAMLLVYQMIVLYTMYSSRPIRSQVSFKLSDSGLDFPVVTICNFNPIRKSHIMHINATGDFPQELLDYLTQTNVEVQALYMNSDVKVLRAGEAALQEYMQTHGNFSVDQFFRDAGFSCGQIMMICSFGGRRFDCCRYTHPVLTNLGRCHTMDLSSGGKEWMKRQISAGASSGLQLILDAHREEGFHGDGEGQEAEPPFSQSFEVGYRFFVHARDTIPYLASEGISVSPVTTVYSALTSSKYLLLPEESWGNCTSVWPRQYNTTLPYSASNCVALCRARFFEDKCGCSPSIYNIDEARRICTPYETYQCMKNNIITTVANVDEVIMPPCDECKKECDSWTYHAYNSYGSGFSHGALKWLNEQNALWTLPHIARNFLVANVFFRDMSYSEYTQQPGTTITEILSDIGGNMGMCLGMSLITCMETLIYLSKLAWIAFSSRRRKHMLQKMKREKAQQERDAHPSRKVSGAAQPEDDPHGPIPRILEIGQHIKNRYLGTGRVAPQQDISRRRSMGHPDDERRARDVRRARFMSDFYNNALYGRGRAQSPEEVGEEGEDVIELKIDLNQLRKASRRERRDGGDERRRTVSLYNGAYYYQSEDDTDEKAVELAPSPSPRK